MVTGVSSPVCWCCACKRLVGLNHWVRLPALPALQQLLFRSSLSPVLQLLLHAGGVFSIRIACMVAPAKVAGMILC